MKTRIRWWVPLLGIALAWVAAFFPACLEAQERLSPRQATLTRYTACYAEHMLLTPLWKIAVMFDSVSPGYREYGATTEVRLEYFEGIITYRVGQDAKATDSELQAMVVHELSHIYTQGLWELARQTSGRWAELLNEQFAAHVSRWPQWQTLCK